MRGKVSSIRVGAAATVLATLIALFVRTHFGVDFTDESFAIAVPYEFAIGARPFVDEIDYHQTAALIVVPLVRLHLLVVGSTDGLVLFVRHAYVAIALATALVAWGAVRRDAGPIGAAGAACAVLAFVFAGMPVPSYNTLGSLGFTSGALLTFAGARRATDERARVALLLGLGTLVHGIAAFAYPPLTLPCAASIGGGLWVVRRAAPARARAATVVVGIIAVSCVLAVVTFALATGVDHLGRSVAYARSVASWPTHRLLETTVQLGRTWKAALVIIGLGLVAREGPRILSSRWWLALLLVIAGIAAIRLESTRLASDFFPGGLWVTLLPALALVELPRSPAAWRTAYGASILAGAVTSFSSTNAATNACLGVLAGGVIGIALLARTVEERADELARRRGRAILATLLLGTTLGQVGDLYAYFYREAAFDRLTARVTSGPFRGIYTTPERRDLLARLELDLATVPSSARTLTCFDDFPAGHLFRPLLPAGASAWILSDREWTRRYRVDTGRRLAATDHDALPDVVLHFGLPAQPGDPLVAAFAHYVVHLRRAEYELLLKPARPPR